MSITTEAELKTAVANWLKRDDLTSYISDFIVLAESQLNREFANMNPPLRAAIDTASGTVSTETIAVPTGFLGVERLSVTVGSSDYILDYRPIDRMAEYDYSGQPLFYTVVGNVIRLAPIPSSSYSYELIYTKKITALSAGSNWTIENAPDLYLYATLLQAAPFIKDDKRLPIWEGFYRGILREIEAQNRKAIGGKLRMVVR